MTLRRLQIIGFLLQRSWTAWISIGAFFVFLMAGQQEFAGLFILLGAVLAMNGLAKTDLILAHRTPQWWREHRALHLLHHINSEGEMAGCLIGLITVATLWLSGYDLSHMHWPVGAFFTLLGIMSAASLTVPYMMPVLGALERISKFVAVYFGSLLSSLTGEPGAAVFLTRYIEPRVKEENRAKVATGLAATIGSGGGLMYHAAPPILIVWSILQSEFGWNLTHLWLYVGLGCLAHVFLGTLYVIRYIEPKQQNTEPASWYGNILLISLVVLVGLHIFSPGNLLWVLDVMIGIVNIVVMSRRYRKRIAARVAQVNGDEHSAKSESDEELESLQEERFAFQWQPLLLATLLVALEIIGLAGEPFILMVASLIPATWPLLTIAIVVFFLSAITSHFADNALASRVYIIVAVAFIPILGLDAATVIAIAVIMGALFGGLLLIPANLPNFAIARILRVLAGEWAAVSWRLYPTAIAYLFVLAFWSWWLG